MYIFKGLSVFVILLLLLNSIAYAEGSEGDLKDYDYEYIADTLKEAGFFKGTHRGYELDRAPMRIEAAVMMVRMLGKEDFVLNNIFQHPFLDVPEWANSYVGYLYAIGLTSGVSSTTYGAEDLITANQYVTFLLRALEYKDNEGDFHWNQAIEKAIAIELITEYQREMIEKDTFLRSHTVLLTYLALKTCNKGSQNPLITTLAERNENLKESEKIILNSFLDGTKDSDEIKIQSEIKEIDTTNWIGQTLTVWSHTHEVIPATEAFEEKYGVVVEVRIIPVEDYPSTIKPFLESGIGAPDVYAAEAAFVDEFVNSGYFTDLGALGATDYADDYIDYVYSKGVDYTGSLRALSWQMAPGAIFYRRSIANEVFGTDDPNTISEMMGSFEGLFDVAKQLKTAGYRLFPDESAFRHFINPKQTPWVDDNNYLLLTDDRIEYFEYAKLLRDKNYTALAGEWSPSWFAGMQGPIITGDFLYETTVFAYCLPSWGLHYVLKPVMQAGENVKTTAGDWAAATGPNPYFWGGNWLGVYEGSSKKDIAFAFINYLAHDEEFLKPWLMETGDVTSVKSIIEASDYIEGRTEVFIGGQNNIEFFVETGKSISGDKFTKYDKNIDRYFIDAVNTYITGSTSLEEAIESFKNAVKSEYPEINVD